MSQNENSPEPVQRWTAKRKAITSFISYYNSGRPRQALNYETPDQHHQKHLNSCKLTA